MANIHDVEYRFLKDGKIEVNGKYYAPPIARNLKEGQRIRITAMPKKDSTIHGKSFLTVNDTWLWFATD